MNFQHYKMNFEKQVNKEHYNFSMYYHKARWCSIWHQVNEVNRFQPDSVLEVGGGLGIFKQTMACFGVPVTIVDIAEDLKPDIVGSVTELPIKDNAFDVACAFQVLEHIPFEMFVPALRELMRVAAKGVVISIPDAKPVYSSQIAFPHYGKKQFWLPRPMAKEVPLPADGEHQWELNRKGYELNKVMNLIRNEGCLIKAQYRVPEHTYHRFFVLCLPPKEA